MVVSGDRIHSSNLLEVHPIPAHSLFQSSCNRNTKNIRKLKLLPKHMITMHYMADGTQWYLNGNIEIAQHKRGDEGVTTIDLVA